MFILVWVAVALVGLVLSLLLLFLVQPHPLIRVLQRLLGNRVVCHLSCAKPLCALTIDDGPSEATSAILDVLKAFGAKATFFIMAGEIEGREEVMQRMVDEGHELANHMVENKPSWRWSADEFERRLVVCEKALNRFRPESGKRWFRPGHGVFTSTMLKTIARHGLTCALGDVFPHDAFWSFPSFYSAYIRARVCPGSIVIVHDRQWTVQTLSTALQMLGGYSFVTLGELWKETAGREPAQPSGEEGKVQEMVVTKGSGEGL